MFLRANGESSPTSSARCMRHQPTAMRFARSVRKNLRTFRQESTCFAENQPTFRRESPAFSSLPTACGEQQRISSLSHSHSPAISPIPLLSPTLSREQLPIRQPRPRVAAEFRRDFTTFLATQRPKTTTSKHIRAKYIQHDTCFRAFLSLAHKKVVHLQWIVVQLWHALAVALCALATQQRHFVGGRRNGFSFSPPPPSGARPQPTQNMASRYK